MKHSIVSTQPVCRAAIPSPLGDLFCAATDDAIVYVMFTPDTAPAGRHVTYRFNHILLRLREQLDEYFSGLRTGFDVPFDLSGTPHRLKVWNALRGIPYGKTVTYKHIAKLSGSAAIAVGQAVGRNPILILIPCHRVVGTDGSLTGYSGGLERKRYLLDLESGIEPRQTL